ncbi:hypothetical protein M9H77_09730 [Catharanthus roseus]|uniref:Uncharacterized protein n=1 Tax=Catharanthus roseus TaxID=4058 RepID=A0ACC0C1L2_CATRO|nr:hypothetical protein M9H77_09730 [Catharanthus roseus]
MSILAKMWIGTKSLSLNYDNVSVRISISPRWKILLKFFQVDEYQAALCSIPVRLKEAVKRPMMIYSPKILRCLTTIAAASAPHISLSFSRRFCSSFSFKLQLTAAALVEDFRTTVPPSSPLLFPTRFRLIWSGDHETCITDLQCRHFGRSLFQSYSTVPRKYKVKKESLEAWILREFTGSETDDDLILRARGFNFLLLRGDMLLDFSRNLVHVCYLSLLEDFDAISTYSWANRGTRTVGYQSARVDRRMMDVDDMATGMIEGPPSSPTQIASFAKKVHTIIRRCMPSHRRPRELVPERSARGVKRGGLWIAWWGTWRLPPVPPNSGRRGNVDLERGEERGHILTRGHGDVGSSDHIDLFDSPDLDMPSFSLGLCYMPSHI